MTLTATDTGGGDFTPAPEGTHVARCVQLIDLGTQYSDFYKKSAHKILLGWELPNELQDDGKPFLVWRRYTLSLSDKSNLRKDLKSWRGREFTATELEGFELRNVVDKACMISVTHSERDKSIYADVDAVMKLLKDMPVPDRISDLVVFDIDEFDQKVFDTFSENLQATINKSAEVTKRNEPQEAAIDAHPADDMAAAFDFEIPF